jgi:hypothetical protein
VHDVALVALQVNVAESPRLTVAAVEVKLTTGAGVATEAEVATVSEFVDTLLPHATRLTAAAAQFNLSMRMASPNLFQILTSLQIYCI